MALNLKEWDDEIASMTADERLERLEALRTLKEWEAHNEHFGWCSPTALIVAFEYAIKRIDDPTFEVSY